MDALRASNLEDTLRLKEKPKETSKKDWNKMNQTACGLIRSYLTQDIKYHVLYKTPVMKMQETLEKKYLTKCIESRLLLKRRLYRFQLKRGLFIAEHMNDCTKFLTDLVNMNVNIKEEDKAVILLNSIPNEEYETFVLALINDRQSLKYNDVSAALVNYEVTRKDK